MKYGVFDKNLNMVTYSYEHHRMKSLNLGSHEVQFEMLPSNGEFYNDEKSYILSGDSVIYNSSYVQHDPTKKYCKIYRYIENKKAFRLDSPPLGHNYVTGLTIKLFPKREFIKGELVKVEWYSDQEYTDLILKVDIVYTRDIAGFAVDRTTTRTWILEDETEHPNKKITKKLYNSDKLSQMMEGVRRRGNAVDSIKIPVLEYMIGTIPNKDGEDEYSRQSRIILTGRNFLAQHSTAFSNFISDSNREIIEEIQISADYWLDNVIDENGTTIRDFMLNELDIGGIA